MATYHPSFMRPVRPKTFQSGLTSPLPGPPKKKKAVTPVDPGVAEINRTEARHTAQARGAAQWLAGVVTALQNSSNAQSAALQGQLGQSALMFEQAGKMGTPFIGSSSPGGFVGGMTPTPESGAAYGRATMAGSLRADLQRVGQADVGTSLIGAANQYASSLPSVYADKVTSYLQDLAEFKEKMRQFGVEQETKRAQITSDENIAAARIKNDAYQSEQDRLSRENIAAGKIKGLSTGGYKGLSASAYSTRQNEWVKKIDTMLKDTDKDGNFIYDPQRIFDTAVSANVRPRDVLAAMHAADPFTDVTSIKKAYTWMLKYLPAANARKVVKQVLGVDPDYYGRSGSKKGKNPLNQPGGRPIITPRPTAPRPSTSPPTASTPGTYPFRTLLG